MPLRRLTARERSTAANWQLAALLAFTAGAVDVSGYLAFHQFTSHMSGTVAGLAADLDRFGPRSLLLPTAILFSFLAGAAFCALIVNWERRREREGLFAFPVLIEALLLASLVLPWPLRHTLLALCTLGFAMGLQNAIITKISHAEIRTTHITGIVTDIGIEFGKALYWNRSAHRTPTVAADRDRLVLLIMLVLLFSSGGALGAYAYPHIGLLLMLPLATLLALPTILPLAADLRSPTLER
jgi:uncharacterized membrane protein YoaK (UPF0700 family)